MSCSYAEGLSEYHDKGVLGLPEIFDSPTELISKIHTLISWISVSNHVVVHTGAGISTSAGVPDFRGPNGVWTLEKIGEKPIMNKKFDDTVPTPTHMALKNLLDKNKIHFIVSQNIDGLHLRSGIPRNKIAELHGNMYVEECDKCHRQFISNTATTSVGKKLLGYACKSLELNGRPCRGRIRDTILDWEHDLPDNDLEIANMHSSMADLNICLGTTLQIIPSGNLPLNNKKYGGKLVICNLQPTKKDKKADLVIHAYVDEIFQRIMECLDLKIPTYDSEQDPTKSESICEYTLTNKDVRVVRDLFKVKCSKVKVSILKKGVKRKQDESKEHSKGENPLYEEKCSKEFPEIKME